MPFDCSTLSEYIQRYQQDAILWKADKLLENLDNVIVRNDRFDELATTISLIPKPAAREDYAKRIGKKYNMSWPTFKKLIDDALQINQKKVRLTRTVRKNQVTTLNGEAKVFPFFTEQISENIKTHERTFKGIKIDKLKFVQLLASFGFTRYASENDTSKEGFTFVRLQDNVISEVSKEEIIDFVEHFISKQYDFDAAGCEYVDSDMLINTFYDGITKYFSKDLFARVRNENEIIINRDKATECFLYYKNGFVCITKDGFELMPYEKMDGSVWNKQMLSRSFEKMDLPIKGTADGTPDLDGTFTTDHPLGIFADFVWRICGMKQQRFASLCTIIGYIVHDYYDYKLKCVEFTDSTISEKSEGRTGKTLLMQLLGKVRSYCEIPGKTFNHDDEKKYQLADRSTQILHINDVNHKGRTRFEFEYLFNDITEGYTVRKMFQSPFIQRSKIVVSTNKSLQIEGASSRDRILEFEMSNFFSELRSPAKYYGQWLGKDWDEREWTFYDNFICFCVQAFLANGLIEPDTINLEARKLLDGTCREFIDFMSDIQDAMKSIHRPWKEYQVDLEIGQDLPDSIYNFEYDKKLLYERFLHMYPDFKSNHFTQKRFTDWLRKYATLALQADTVERRSNGTFYIRFVHTPNALDSIHTKIND